MNRCQILAEILRALVQTLLAVGRIEHLHQEVPFVHRRRPFSSHDKRPSLFPEHGISPSGMSLGLSATSEPKISGSLAELFDARSGTITAECHPFGLRELNASWTNVRENLPVERA
jgi:hypothetical protein